MSPQATIQGANIHGFGGACGQAAIAINQAVFANKGRLVGFFNRAFYNKGHLIGHVAVLVGKFYWDSDGKRKRKYEVEHWGMLDYSDPDHKATAKKLGVKWTEDTASETITVPLTEEEVKKAFGSDQIPDFLMELLAV